MPQKHQDTKFHKIKIPANNFSGILSFSALVAKKQLSGDSTLNT